MIPEIYERGLGWGGGVRGGGGGVFQPKHFRGKVPKQSRLLEKNVKVEALDVLSKCSTISSNLHFKAYVYSYLKFLEPCQ